MVEGKKSYEETKEMKKIKMVKRAWLRIRNQEKKSKRGRREPVIPSYENQNILKENLVKS